MEKRKEILILLQAGPTESSLYLPLPSSFLEWTEGTLARWSLFLLSKKPPVVYKQCAAGNECRAAAATVRKWDRCLNAVNE